MRIGIIGSGHIGGTLARLLARAGHEVAVSNPVDTGGLAQGGRRQQPGSPLFNAP